MVGFDMERLRDNVLQGGGRLTRWYRGMHNTATISVKPGYERK